MKANKDHQSLSGQPLAGGIILINKLIKPRFEVEFVRHMRKGLRYLCLVYTALLLLGSAIGMLIGFATEYGDRSGVGCNFYDALLYGIECRGFVGAWVIELLVGFPLLLGQLSAIALSSPVLLMLALSLWLPVFFTLYWVLRRLTSRSKGRAASSAPLS